MTFTKLFVLGAIVATAGLSAVSPAMATEEDEFLTRRETRQTVRGARQDLRQDGGLNTRGERVQFRGEVRNFRSDARAQRIFDRRN